VVTSFEVCASLSVLMAQTASHRADGSNAGKDTDYAAYFTDFYNSAS